MADRRGDGMRQQPFSSSSSGQERVFDGGGGSAGAGAGQPFGSDFDHGSSSYMSLLGAGGVNSQQPPQHLPWGVDDVSAAPQINLVPQFSMSMQGNYGPSSSTSYQQSASFVSPFAANLHPYPSSYLHADPPPQWPPRSMPAPSSLPARNFAVLPAPFPHEQDMHMQLLRAAAFGAGGDGPHAGAAPVQAPIEQPAKDGYNWRKYGQKQLKDAESPRSYYKCTRDGCTVKKIVERSFDGCIKEITYKGRHSHPRPPEPRRGHSGAARGAEDAAAVAVAAAAEEADDEASDDDPFHEDDGEDGHGRGAGGVAGQRVVKKHKIILQTPSEVDLLDDGYRWRKYGQKVVKGNSRPRSYYKCTAENCNVRKQIERASDDPKYVLTTYTGRHSHDPPGRSTGATGGASADPPPHSTMGTAAAGGSSQQPSGSGARQTMKEESRS